MLTRGRAADGVLRRASGAALRCDAARQGPLLCSPCAPSRQCRRPDRLVLPSAFLVRIPVIRPMRKPYDFVWRRTHLHRLSHVHLHEPALVEKLFEQRPREVVQQQVVSLYHPHHAHPPRVSRASGCRHSRDAAPSTTRGGRVAPRAPRTRAPRITTAVDGSTSMASGTGSPVP